MNLLIKKNEMRIPLDTGFPPKEPVARSLFVRADGPILSNCALGSLVGVAMGIYGSYGGEKRLK